MKLVDVLKLMRPEQWFKSFSILLGASIVFYQTGITTNMIIRTIISLIAVSLLSSSIYALNDVADYDKDRIHPVKKNRSIANNKITRKEGIIIAIILLIFSVILLYALKPFLVLIGLLMLLNNLLYSFKPLRLKNLPVLDVLSAGLNFSLRVLIGWYALTDAVIFRIVVLFPFFISGFLLSCKRLGEYIYLGRKAEKFRSAFKYYNKKTLKLSINVYLTLSILGYYFFSNIFNKNLFLLGPWLFIQMYWYTSFTKEKDSIVKKPEDVFVKKPAFITTSLLFCITWLFVLLLS